MRKTFTLSEAQTLLPVLEALVHRAQSAAVRGAELELEMETLNRRIFLSGGLQVDIASAARRRAERDKAVQEASTTLAEIEEIGAKVHDLALGLLDIPCQVESGIVMLCWKMGESAIEHWHDEREEPVSRLPLDWRFGRGERDRLN
ncbi:MAG: hypothetical protein NVSMB3_05650 [Acidobacteriaceae bacterium]